MLFPYILFLFSPYTIIPILFAFACYVVYNLISDHLYYKKEVAKVNAINEKRLSEWQQQQDLINKANTTNTPPMVAETIKAVKAVKEIVRENYNCQYCGQPTDLHSICPQCGGNTGN